MSKPESGTLNAMNKSFLRENIALIFAVLLALIFSREIYHHFGWVLGSFVLVFSMLFCFSKYKKYNVDLKISKKYVIISDAPEIKSINDDIVSGLDSKEIGRRPYQSARGISSRRLDRFIDVKNKPECEREKIENNFMFVFLSRVQQLIPECYFIEPVLSYPRSLCGFRDATDHACGIQYKNMALVFPAVGLSALIITEFNMRDDLWYSLSFLYDGKCLEVELSASEYTLKTEYFYKFAIELAEVWDVKLVYRNVNMN